MVDPEGTARTMEKTMCKFIISVAKGSAPDLHIEEATQHMLSGLN